MKREFSRFTRFSLFVGAVLALTTACALLIIFGLPDRADYSGQTLADIGRVAPEINAIAPPFTLETLDSDGLNLLNLRGESVVVNFWATWCPPCIVEMPALQTLHNEIGVRILGVNMGEDRAIIAQWIAENDITFDILLDPQATVSDDYRLRGQPSTYVIAPDGIITHIFYGSVSMNALKNALDSHKT